MTRAAIECGDINWHDTRFIRIGERMDKVQGSSSLASSLASSRSSSILQKLRSSERGLSESEAQERLGLYGHNELTQGKRANAFWQLVRVFANPLTLILIVASLVSVATGSAVESALILVIVLMGGLINFFQEKRSRQLVESLQASVATTATVLRDGQLREIPRNCIVPGDVLALSSGDLIPADGWLLSAKDLHVQEAALTGESLPVEKLPIDFAGGKTDPEAASPAASSRVLMGSSVVSGTARFVVSETGPKTAFGEIATRLGEHPPETEFERGIRRFGFLIMETVFALTVLVFLFNLSLDRDPLNSLLFSIALAVGLTPEFLPMIISVTLSAGASHMAKRNVIVKRLEAIQNLGSIDILCSDKTGTLTVGRMTLDQAVDLQGQASQTAERLGFLNSSFESGIKSPLDIAILEKLKFSLAGIEKIDEIPFDFERRRLSVVVEEAGERRLICKGAPESLLGLCVSFESGGQTRPLDAHERMEFQSKFEGLSSAGFRVLAVCSRIVSHKAAYEAADERDLVFHGFLPFVDQPLPAARDAIANLERDSVKVKVLSGDNELVAKHVCASVGLNTDRIVLGSEVDRMTDAALGKTAEDCDVFARLNPAHKSRIVLALKARGHVIGYMGDGVNDAPSLHLADVGISFGYAVDVAKEAAGVILLRPDLSVLHWGILEGRRAFGNVMKYLLMGTSSNFGNMFSMAAASVFLPFLPMLPFQIILNNFLYDTAQIMIPSDHVDSSFTRKPRTWDIALIRRFMISIGPISSAYDFLTFFVLLHWFKAGEPLFHTGWFVESLVTQTLVIFVIRTMRSPLRSRPSGAMSAMALAVTALAIAIPYLPFMKDLGFVPLPPHFFIFLIATVGSYLWLVEKVKLRVFGTNMERGESDRESKL